jgi:hypothetical protein
LRAVENARREAEKQLGSLRETVRLRAEQRRNAPKEAARKIDEDGVDNFAVAMKAKLAKKRDDGRGGWQDKEQCSAEFLSQLLREHVEKGDPVDVANLAMMLHQRGERII